jgi:hypothetical protein
LSLLDSRLHVVVAAIAWAGVLGVGFAGLERYAAAAGTAGAPGADVTETFALYRQPGRALAVMTIHPKCPCTSASLAEFGDFLARAGSACDGLLVQLMPEEAGADWLPAATRSLGGRSVPVVADQGGRLAASLGAETSGHVVLLDAAGGIGFQGGITLSRGHRGRSPAQDAMLDVVLARDGSPVELCAAPVYGCALQAPSATVGESAP